MAELTRKAQIAAGADLAPLTPGEQLVKTLAAGGGGSGGGGVLYATYTLGEQTVGGISATCDKTFAEIHDAIESGKYVIALIQFEYNIAFARITSMMPREIVFGAIDVANQNDSLLVYQFSITHALDTESQEIIRFNDFDATIALQTT